MGARANYESTRQLATIMPLSGAAQVEVTKPLSVRRQVEHRILRFSVCMGFVATLIAGFVYVGSHYPALREAQQINLQALTEMHCEGTTCSTSDFTTDPYTASPDYVLDIECRCLISTPGSTGVTPTRFEPLDFCGISFIKQFHEPASYTTMDGDVWRLYSPVSRPGNDFRNRGRF